MEYEDINERFQAWPRVLCFADKSVATHLLTHSLLKRSHVNISHSFVSMVSTRDAFGYLTLTTG